MTAPGPTRPLRHLTLDASEGDDGIVTLEATASTRSDDAHAAALAEAQALLAWVRRRWPHGEGALDDGADWDHALEARDEPGGWRSLVLTISGRPAVTDAVQAAFPVADEADDDIEGG